MTELTTTANDLTRLHITPFNPNLYEKIIPASIRKPGRKVSFHAIQTYPERGFGYLEVPKSDAETLKRKLNGSMLKGTKIRIEEAKPVMKRKIETDDEPVMKRKKKTKTEEPKKRNVVMPGYELEEDRYVKRGWTEDKSASKKPKAAADTATKHVKHGKDKKLLFKTVVPPNMALAAEEKNKKRGEKRKPKTKKGEVVVEEFGKNRSTFAVSQASSAERKPAVAYEDGRGWVDEDGEIVEAEPEKLQQHRQRAEQEVAIVAARQVSPSASSSDESEEMTVQPTVVDVDMHDQADSTSDSDSESTASSSSAAASSSSDEVAEPESTTDVPDIHPLEALYKRAKTDAKDQLPPINTSFSFFNATDDTTDETTVIQPQTPHTKQDMEWRGQRSAAPTPDTAAIDGRFGFPFGASDDESEDVTPTQPAPVDNIKADDQEESAFRKFFYEKRGDTDRAWKKRRREAKKLQRQRENRRLGRKIV